MTLIEDIHDVGPANRIADSVKELLSTSINPC
jgi:hypothetical protein